MSFSDQINEPGLPSLHVLIATRAANEGIPVAAIGRILNQPFSLVEDLLKSALGLGHIGQMPKGDWPPSAPWSSRMPTVPRCANAEDIGHACKTNFRLTPLEAAIMVVLLRTEVADKDKLHGVVEQMRQQRQQRPDNPEETDPKIVDVVVCKLRKKLKLIDERFKLTTSWGKGYYFDPKVKELIYASIGGTPQEVAEAAIAAHTRGAARH